MALHSITLGSHSTRTSTPRGLHSATRPPPIYSFIHTHLHQSEMSKSTSHFPFLSMCLNQHTTSLWPLQFRLLLYHITSALFCCFNCPFRRLRSNGDSPTFHSWLLSFKQKETFIRYHLNSVSLLTFLLRPIAFQDCNYILPHFTLVTHLTLKAAVLTANALQIYL